LERLKASILIDYLHLNGSKKNSRQSVSLALIFEHEVSDQFYYQESTQKVPSAIQPSPFKGGKSFYEGK